MNPQIQCLITKKKKKKIGQKRKSKTLSGSRTHLGNPLFIPTRIREDKVMTRRSQIRLREDPTGGSVHEKPS